ncbi:MAG TPA: ATP-binding protein [Pirellulales bacterium]|jgi:two-component system phosphate regulon sensor histidine kinase PhoR|nr:ATP-binding protein [Pirellulales bacterium]
MPAKRLLWRLYLRMAGLLAVSLAASSWLVARFDGPAAKLVVGTVLVAAMALVFSWVVGRWVSDPLAKVREAADRVAAGDFEHKLRLPDDAEMDHLTEAFQAMSRQWAGRLSALTRRNDEQEAVLASMAEGVLAVDPDERIISLNPAAARLMGVNPREVEGRSLPEVVRNADLNRFVADALACKRPIEGDVVLRGARDCVLQAHGTALRDGAGHSMGAVIVLNDVSRLRQLENIRRDFAANVSHELKTPITSIKGFVETLLDGALRDAADAERFLRIIARQADRLNAIIEDLLSLSRIEKEADAADIVLAAVSVRELLDTARNDCDLPATERNVRISLECDGKARVRANAALLGQAITNLLDNAIKYSEPGGEVWLSARNGDGGVMIEVRDQGCGIAEEHLPRLFERFYRVDKARSRKLGGTGLGLAIVKHIVLAHRGEVTVASQPGKGSAFTIHLPPM